jgi:hypothetical protein
MADDATISVKYTVDLSDLQDGTEQATSALQSSAAEMARALGATSEAADGLATAVTQSACSAVASLVEALAKLDAAPQGWTDLAKSIRQQPEFGNGDTYAARTRERRFIPETVILPGYGSGASGIGPAPPESLPGISTPAADQAAPNPPQPASESADRGEKSANEARQIADARTQAWEQSNLAIVASEQEHDQVLFSMGQETADKLEAQELDLAARKLAIQRQYWTQKAAQDANDPVAHARDIAKLAELDQQYAEEKQRIEDQASERSRAMQDKAVDDHVRALAEQLKADRESIDDAFRIGQIDAQQRADFEQQTDAQIVGQEIELLRQRQAVYAEGTDAYRQYADKIRDIQNQLTADGKASAQQLADYQKEQWQQAESEITSSFDSLTDSFFNRKQKLGTDLLMFVGDFIKSEIKNDLNYALEEGLSAIGLGSGPRGGGGFLVQGAQALFGGGANAAQNATELAQLTQLNANLTLLNASLTGHTAATTLNTSASTLNTTAHTAGTAATAVNTTATGLNTTTQTTGIVAWVENTVATIGNTVATEASAIGHLFGFASGADNIPHDMVAMVHQGEMIVPAANAPAVRGLLAGSAAGGFAMPDFSLPDLSMRDISRNMSFANSSVSNRGGDAYHANVNYAPNINLANPQSWQALLRGHESDIAAAVTRGIRSGSPQRPSLRTL